MEIGYDTRAVLEYLDATVEQGLRKRDDVGVVLELCAQQNNPELFNDTARTGTGLWKVYKTLRRLQPGAEGYTQLEREFGNLINEFREYLARIVENSDNETLKRFDDVYFGMTNGVVRNLVDLAHDLSSIKDLQKE